jgi:hypothetical protein
MTIDANKYGRHNWRNGMAFSRLFAATLRHLFLCFGGKTRDEKSGLSHLAHTALCVLFLLEYGLLGSGIDDRYV